MTPPVPDGVSIAATRAFGAYAAMDAPRLPHDLISAAQVQAVRWGVRNFGAEPAHRHVLGLVEEASEMLDAASGLDARKEMGDVLICAMQLCTCFRFDFGTILAAAEVDQVVREGVDAGDSHLATQMLLSAIGGIARAVLKGEQRIRGMDDPIRQRDEVGFGVYLLCIYARSAWTDVERIVLDRMEAILKRDYKRDPLTGGR